MFITEEQLENRRKNPKNLANSFNSGRENKYAPIIESRLSEIPSKKTSSGPQIEESECLPEQDGSTIHESSIQHREIKRPGNFKPWLSKSERTGIAAEFATSAYNIDGTRKTQTEIARSHGVQVSTVSDIVNDTRRAPNTSRSVDKQKVEEALSEVRDAAIGKLNLSLRELTEDKISSLSAKDISLICDNMSKVVARTIPQENNNGQQINLVVYTPEMRTEKSFEVVEIE